jgi:dCMP deaminase
LIETIYTERENFILIGLTGRIGSGCTTSANFLSQTLDEHNLRIIQLENDSTDNKRKKFIIDKFYRTKWKPFFSIRASDIITIFILKYNFDEINQILDDTNNTLTEVKIKQNTEEELSQLERRLLSFDEIIKLPEEIKEYFNTKHDVYEDFLQQLDEYNTSNIDSLYTLLNDIKEVSNILKEKLSAITYKNYTDIFQLFGDNIRLYGDIKINEEKKNPNNIYTISKNINKIIQIIRKYNENENKPTYIVIDAIRNSIENLYFKEKYSNYYLFAINADDQDIEDRLLENGHMTREDIKKQSKKEYQTQSLKNEEDFVSQNIQECIAKSDIFIVNNGKLEDKDSNVIELYGQLIKYISLIRHPGLITPSNDEKMMQIAYTAKLNSGCISRQVGASVTNKNGSLKSIGWNSVAEGQTPCILRSKEDLLSNTTSKAYSQYEKSSEFKNMIQTTTDLNTSFGLNQSFCFKSIYTKNTEKEKGNQVHTRALHAEENAFLQLAKYGSEAIKGGTLYSTASPCELCSKKAYQLGIERIVYIDPYPGIAKEQILKSGLFPPKIDLFKGAIGQAYHKLFEQIVPYKDELECLTM